MNIVDIAAPLPRVFPQIPRDKWAALSARGVLVAIGNNPHEALENAKRRGENTPVITKNLTGPRI